MIKRKEAMNREVKSNLRGGAGDIGFQHIFEGEELSKTRLFSMLCLEPGSSVGIHSHEGEGEAYLILDGVATVTEDGVEYLLHPGDAEYCTDGHTHGVANHSDKPVSLLAIVIL